MTQYFFKSLKSVKKILITSLMFIPGVSHAQGLSSGVDKLKRTLTGSGVAIIDRDPSGTAYEILGRVINWLLSIVAVLALAALIIGAIMYIVALGEDDKIKRAKKIIIGAIIGLLLVGFSFAIISLVQGFLVG